MKRERDAKSARLKLPHQVAATARAKGLFEAGDHLLVCVSGGPDSVALLSVLVELAPSWRLALSVVHVNHGLRGAESDEDARFVAGLCADLNLPCVCEPIDLGDWPAAGAIGEVRAGRRQSSLQALAREVRYRVIRRVARRLAADKIALGHTADDQAETLLMWMLRGAGATGLAGIPEAREGVWVRPLLEVSRARILAYLDESGARFRMDSSNAKPVYLRNRIRHELLPVLKEYSPALVQILTRQSRILREEDRYLEQLAAEEMERLTEKKDNGSVVLERDGLIALPLALQRRVVRAVLRRLAETVQGPRFGAVEAILDRIVRGRSGATLSVAGARASRTYGRIHLQSLSHGADVRLGPGDGDEGNFSAVATALPATLKWPLAGREIRLTVRDGPPSELALFARRHGARVSLDADRVSLPVFVRSWRSGDWFQPAGMHGRRKKLQDYFSDNKIPRDERGRLPILASSEGILWVGGYRADQRFCATADTRRTLIAELVGAEPGKEIG